MIFLYARCKSNISHLKPQDTFRQNDRVSLSGRRHSTKFILNWWSWLYIFECNLLRLRLRLHRNHKFIADRTLLSFISCHLVRVISESESEPESESESINESESESESIFSPGQLGDDLHAQTWIYSSMTNNLPCKYLLILAYRLLPKKQWDCDLHYRRRPNADTPQASATCQNAGRIFYCGVPFRRIEFSKRNEYPESYCIFTTTQAFLANVAMDISLFGRTTTSVRTHLRRTSSDWNRWQNSVSNEMFLHAQFHATSREDPYQDAPPDGIGCGRPRERCVL